MINEVIEVKGYLDGKNINKKNLYRICYMIAKWYKEQGFKSLEIRKKIFDWGKENNIYIKYNVNNIITSVFKDNERLKDYVNVKINKRDIDEINKRFDSRVTKLVALAMLCYAKAHANGNKEFSISSVALSAWINKSSNHLRSRYIKELIEFGYLSLVSTPRNTYAWNNAEKNSVYRINVDIHNSGDYVLVDNNILDLYNSIF